MRKILVITKEGCPQCVKLKEFFKENGVKYNELNASKDTKFDLKAVFPEAKCYPCVQIGNDWHNYSEIIYMTPTMLGALIK